MVVSVSVTPSPLSRPAELKCFFIPAVATTSLPDSPLQSSRISPSAAASPALLLPPLQLAPGQPEHRAAPQQHLDQPGLDGGQHPARPPAALHQPETEPRPAAERESLEKSILLNVQLDTALHGVPPVQSSLQ